MRQAMARMRRVSRPTAASLETHVRFTKHLERARGGAQGNKPPKTKGPTLGESRSGGARGFASGGQRTDLSPGWVSSASKTRPGAMLRLDGSIATTAVNAPRPGAARSGPAAEDCRADPDVGGAAGNGDLEVVAHAHRQ